MKNKSSQSNSVEEARKNPQEVLELLFEDALQNEIMAVYFQKFM